jgi:hypothetical protein
MKKRTSFVVVDLIEDKIKTRALFIAISLLFYIYLSWMFLVGKIKANIIPDSIEITMDFPHALMIGETASEFITPQVKVVNSQGQRLDGITVMLKVVDVSSDTQKQK